MRLAPVRIATRSVAGVAVRSGIEWIARRPDQMSLLTELVAIFVRGSYKDPAPPEPSIPGLLAQTLFGLLGSCNS